MATRSRKAPSAPKKSQTNLSQGGNSQKVALKKGSRVAKIRLQESGKNSQSRRVFPLLGDRYFLGRSSSCDIQLQNPLVSQTHCSLRRDPDHPNQFFIRDEGSSNGIYLQRRRLKSYRLHHGDEITLGPPELVDVPKLVYFNPPPLWLKGMRTFFSTGILFFLIITGAIAWQWSKIPVKPMPSGVTGPVKVYAGDGVTEINPIKQEIHREFDNLSDFSPYLPQAVIASEDTRFYWHFGVDPYGLGRAIYINLQDRDVKQGASTLTQQLARSLFSEVGRENTAGRKIREMFVALKLEAVYSKDEILKAYLNRVYLGAGNYGFEDAAQFYFDKSAQDLDVGEAATLVAMLPAPNLYNPVQDYQTSVQLRNRVIERMAMLGMIDEQEANRARRSRIQVSPKATQTLSQRQAPYFYGYIFGELNQLLGEDVADEGNFVVETSLNLKMQALAEKSLQNFLTTEGKKYAVSQGAVVTLDSRTGAVLAMVGGKSYRESQFNRASQAQRQPGSTFKLFAYTAAIAKGVRTDQAFECGPFTWQGQNYKPCERSGAAPAITFTEGFTQSENVVALRVAQTVGLGEIIALAKDFGVNSPLGKEPGLVLGQSETRVLEMTGAYGAIANGGMWNRPHGIVNIRDGGDCPNPEQLKGCREIYQVSQDARGQKQVVSPAIAATMTQMLQAAVNNGTGQAAQIGYGAAGKTGTTDKAVDLWFIGFLPQKNLVTGIWLGNDDSSPTQGSSGLAATLWGQYMRQIASL
ncbi:PBP1A family penicillin-binding protein [Synechocystis salina LEGE 06099]|uniref:PBP1A family penicillin-binding protein n=1 Tax=Synechocystis salina TaxID=945780 RepID=UPI0018827486|nr:PBP1A family penicillin-binding protein [Synechocystis salina]MBE9202994.1 PBP1A family penicillin-binding protein [Synechocystis salina LEGE 06099]